MEGLAISPDGGTLFGILQSPLIQDGGLDEANNRAGTNARLVALDVETGAVREFLYTLDHQRNGISEVLAVNDHELLVLERDGRVGSAATFKKVFRIDITTATDIRGLKQLPQTGIPTGVTPAAKELFLDLLKPEYGIVGPATLEKFEGLAFGPDLGDARHTLVVTTDNDFDPARPSLFYVFAIESADLPGFEEQEVEAGPCRRRGHGHDDDRDDA